MPDSQLAYRYSDSCIVMFARAPVLGQVKTRLIPALGNQGALDIHIELMHQQIEVLNQSALCSAQLWVDQQPRHSTFKNFTGEVKLQDGQNLGDKMYHATQEVLKHFSKVIIIGSDCPDIDEAYLEQALQELDKNTIDVVLGPALDGGYVLIAMKQIHQGVFQDIEWGSEFVLQQTVSKLNNYGLRFFLLSALRDIDTSEDLLSLEQK
ncbi:MAG: TIGR04282 family arsenosugar biosynthesis glycosyltransferase [Pseudohongiellaceae bacterium]